MKSMGPWEWGKVEKGDRRLETGVRKKAKPRSGENMVEIIRYQHIRP